MKDFIDHTSISDDSIFQLRKFNPGASLDDTVSMLLRQCKRIVSDATRVAEKFTSEQLGYLQSCVHFENIRSDTDEHLADQLAECIAMDDPDTDEGDFLPPDWYGMVRRCQELSIGEQIALIHLLEKRARLTDMVADEDS